MLDFKFKGDTNYNMSYNKTEDQKLPPQYQRDYDERFLVNMKTKMQKGEFGGLLQAPFMAKCTSHEHFRKGYNMPKAQPHPPIEEVRTFLKSNT